MPAPHSPAGLVWYTAAWMLPLFKLLVAERALSEQLAAAMLAWRHSGFSVHDAVRVRAHDAEGRKKLAQYMLRAPFSLQKMTYDANNGMVIYRSRLHKGLKRDFQLMAGAQWRGRTGMRRWEHRTRGPTIRYPTSPDMRCETPLSCGGEGEAVATHRQLF